MSSVADVIGPADPKASESGEVSVIADFAADTLVPHANRIDQRGIRRPHLDELAATGALGLPFPTALGDRTLAPESFGKQLSSSPEHAAPPGSAAQHRTPTKAVLGTDNVLLHDRWAARMVSGKAIAAIAFAHLRRPTQRFWIRDEGDQFLLNGSLDWVTNWPLADVVLIEGYRMSSSGEQRDEIISLLVEPPKLDLVHSNQMDRDDLQAGPSLSLAAMGGTQTWPVSFADFRVSGEQLVSRVPATEWHHANSLIAADANPASFGMARASINELTELAATTNQPTVAEAAASLRSELLDLRARAYADADLASADPQMAAATVVERTALRAAALDLNLRAATALVAASGGGAMMLSSNAQRRARSAVPARSRSDCRSSPSVARLFDGLAASPYGADLRRGTAQLLAVMN